jgi:hypothetical protein
LAKNGGFGFNGKAPRVPHSDLRFYISSAKGKVAAGSVDVILPPGYEFEWVFKPEDLLGIPKGVFEKLDASYTIKFKQAQVGAAAHALNSGCSDFTSE